MWNRLRVHNNRPVGKWAIPPGLSIYPRAAPLGSSHHHCHPRCHTKLEVGAFSIIELDNYWLDTATTDIIAGRRQESGGHRVQVFSPEGAFLDTWGTRGDGPGEFASAMTVALDNDMRVYVSDWGNSRVQVFDSTGRFLHQIGAPGTGSGEMTNPTGVAIGPEGDLWVMDRGNDRIQRFRRDGTFVQHWAQAADGVFNSPTNIAFDKDGNWWVSEFEGHRVLQFSPDGELLFELAPCTFRGPDGLLFDSTGALYVADTGNGVVRKFRRPAR